MNIPRIPTSVASGSGSNAIVTIVSSLALVAAKAIIENEIKKHYLKKLAARETNPASTVVTTHTLGIEGMGFSNSQVLKGL